MTLTTALLFLVVIVAIGAAIFTFINFLDDEKMEKEVDLFAAFQEKLNEQEERGYTSCTGSCSHSSVDLNEKGQEIPSVIAEISSSKKASSKKKVASKKKTTKKVAKKTTKKL